VGFTALLGFGVNVSFFILVKRTSPLTVNVVGYLKTIMVFVLGALFFDGSMSAQNFLGIACTLIGVLAYSYTKEQEAREKLAALNEDSKNNHKPKNNSESVEMMQAENKERSNV